MRSPYCLLKPSSRPFNHLAPRQSLPYLKISTLNTSCVITPKVRNLSTKMPLMNEIPQRWSLTRLQDKGTQLLSELKSSLPSKLCLAGTGDGVKQARNLCTITRKPFLNHACKMQQATFSSQVHMDPHNQLH